MTLYKRIGILISIQLLVLLTVVLAINFIMSKNYMQKQLEINAKNTAYALSMSLGATFNDEEKVKSVIDTVFKRGMFELIELQDVQKIPVYKKMMTTGKDIVPSWFKNIFQIETDETEVVVTSGNDLPLGTLVVKADRKMAYQELYALFKYTILIFLIFGILELLILRIVLKMVLVSLEAIKKQADAILHNHFIVLKDLPPTLELREIAEVMNSIVKRVKELYERSSETMKKNQEVLYRDSLTHLFNRRYFQLKLPEYLLANDSRSKGSLVLIRINGVVEANKAIGHKKMDEFFFEFAQILQKDCESVHEPLICRINGTEMVLVLPVLDATAAKELSRTVLKDFLLLSDRYKIRNICYLSIGITEYTKKESIAKLLSCADHALSDAAFYNDNHIAVFEPDDKNRVILGKTQWREIIINAMEEGRLEPEFEPVFDLTKNEKVAYKLTFDIKQNGYTFKYGDYLPAIVELGLEHDLAIYELEYLKKHRFVQNALSFEIFAKTLQDSDKYLNFRKSILEITENLKSKLFIEISEYDILSLDSTVVEHISSELRKFDIRFGINHLSGETGNYGYLKYAAPAYIKMYESLYLDMDNASRNAFLTLLGSLDVRLIIVGAHKENIEDLKQRGIRYAMFSS